MSNIMICEGSFNFQKIIVLLHATKNILTYIEKMR